MHSCAELDLSMLEATSHFLALVMSEHNRFTCKLDVLNALDRLLSADPNLSVKESIATLEAQSAGYSESLFGDFSFVQEWVELWISNKLELKNSSSLDAKVEFSALGAAAIDYATAFLHSRNAKSRTPSIFSFSPLTSRYQIGELIGDGGMGRVYTARDKASGERVAIKALLLPDPRFLEKLKSEFRMLQGLVEHPSIVSHRELFVQDDEAALVMDFVEGCSFSKAWSTASSKEIACGLLFKLADALNHLHSHKIVHLDIKPDNILVRDDHSLTILDFGLARRWGFGGSTSQIAGSRRFMSPEQIRGGEVGPASDWYSLGVLLFTCVADSHLSGGELFLLSQKPKSLRDSEINFACPLVRLAIRLVHQSPQDRPGFQEIKDVLATFGIEHSGPTSSVGQLPFAIPRKESQQLLSFFIDRKKWPAVIEIVGQSGIGKSSFLEQAKSDLVEQWPTFPKPKVFLGNCFSREHVSYPGLDHIIDQIVDDLVDETPLSKNEIEPLGLSSLCRMFPGIARLTDVKPAPTDTEALSFGSAIGALEKLLGLYSKHAPVFFLIDDFQWANLETNRVLERLIKSDLLGRFGLVIARRPESSQMSLLSSLTLKKRIQLEPFGIAECGLYLKNNFGIQQDKRLNLLSSLLHRESLGIPVYMEELAPHLISSATDVFQYDRMLINKFEKLSDSQFQLLSMICCTEFPMNRDFLAASTDLSNFEESLRFLENKRLVTRSHDRNLVKPFHSIVSSHFQRFAGEASLKVSSGKLVGYLRQEGIDNDALLGEQLERVGEQESAAMFTVRAAEKMLARFAYYQAEDLYQKAIGRLPPAVEGFSSTKLEWEERLAAVYALNGKHEASGQLFEQLADAVDEPKKKIEFQQKAVFQKQIGNQYGVPTAEADWLAKTANIKLYRNPLLLKLLTVTFRALRRIAPVFGFYARSHLTDEQLQIIGNLAKGYILPNPLLASYLAARMAFECKKNGKLDNLSAALDIESIFFEGVKLPWPFGLLASAEIRSHKTKMSNDSEPLRRGLYHLSNSIRDFTRGDMLGSLKENDIALSNYQLGKPESSWEIELLAGFKVYAKHWFGDFNGLNLMLTNRERHIEINETVSSSHPRSQFAELAKLPGFLMSAVSNALVQDKVETAVGYLQLAKELCQSHYFSGRLHERSFCEHFVAMYCGNYDVALKNNRAQHSLIKRNGYSLSPVIRVQLYLYQAAILTQMSVNCPKNAALHESELLKLRNKLNKYRFMGFARGISCSIDAYFQFKNGHEKEFETSTMLAIREYESVGFFCCSNFLRYHASLSPKSDVQREWRADSLKWAEANGIQSLENFSRIASPRLPKPIVHKAHI